MPRDGSGNYTLPVGNPVVSGTIIDAGWANPTLSDIANQLNNVLTRDGVLGPTQPFKQVDGSVAFPAYSFVSSTSTGMSRVASGQLNFSVTGTEILRLSATQTLTTLGSAAAPVWSFIGDPNTGVYSPGADQIAFATNGVLRATLSNAAFTLAAGTAFTGSGAGLTAIPAANLTGAVPSGSLTSVPAASLTGTLPNGVFPATLPAVSGANLTALSAGNLTGSVPSGTLTSVPAANLTGSVPSGTLTSVPATSLTGNIAQARLATVLNAAGSAPLYSIRGWARYNAVTISQLGGGNITVTRTGVGRFTATFTTAMDDVNYAVLSGVGRTGAGDSAILTVYNGGLATTGFDFITTDEAGDYLDVPFFSIAIVR